MHQVSDVADVLANEGTLENLVEKREMRKNCSLVTSSSNGD